MAAPHQITVPVMMPWIQENPISGKSPTVPFYYPNAISKISFTPLEFLLATARAVCRNNAPLPLLQSQFNAALAAIGTLIRRKGHNVSLLSDIEFLNETKANGITHDIGVATAYILAGQLGYNWSCLAEEVIKPNGKTPFINRRCPDMLFDTGSGPNCYIAVEAKGSTAKNVSGARSALKSTVSDSCKNQVGNVIGLITDRGIPIVHGYAIGGLLPRGGNVAEVHVCEIARGGSRKNQGLCAKMANLDMPGSHPMLYTAVQTYLSAAILQGDRQCFDLFKKWSWAQGMAAAQDASEYDTSDASVGFNEIQMASFQGHQYRLSTQLAFIDSDTNEEKIYHLASNAAVTRDLLDKIGSDKVDAFERIDLSNRLGEQAGNESATSFVHPTGLALLAASDLED